MKYPHPLQPMTDARIAEIERAIQAEKPVLSGGDVLALCFALRDARSKLADVQEAARRFHFVEVETDTDGGGRWRLDAEPEAIAAMLRAGLQSLDDDEALVVPEGPPPMPAPDDVDRLLGMVDLGPEGRPS